MKTDNDHAKRWILPKPINEDLTDTCNFSHILQKILIRRGIDINKEWDEYLKPSDLPNPENHFKELD